MSPHIDWAQLVDYWAGDLATDAEAAIEEHALGCDACTELSAQVAALTESLRSWIPPVLTRALLQCLNARGLRILDNPMQPGERRRVLFPHNVDVLVQRLGGLALSDVTRISCRLTEEGTEQVIADLADAPFDRDSDCLLIACQRHFRDLPPNVVFALRLQREDGSESGTTYTILHEFESSPSP